MFHAQMGAGPRRGERPGDDALQVLGVPGVGQRPVGLHRLHLTVDRAPIGCEIEAVPLVRAEIVLHQPFLDQVRLGQRPPDLFRRIGHFPFDDDVERFGFDH
ncbi:hypothetical protein D9M72_613050 [compost metagenome]